MPHGAQIGRSRPRQPDRRKVQATRPESACGSKEFNRPFPFPSRESRGGRVAPHAEARCAPAQTTVTHRCTRLPPQKGCRPLAHPLRARWSTLRRRYTTGTFYLATKRNFLLGLDTDILCAGTEVRERGRAVLLAALRAVRQHSQARVHASPALRDPRAGFFGVNRETESR